MYFRMLPYDDILLSVVPPGRRRMLSGFRPGREGKLRLIANHPISPLNRQLVVMLTARTVTGQDQLGHEGEKVGQ